MLVVLDALRKMFELGREMNCNELHHLFSEKIRIELLEKLLNHPSMIVCKKVLKLTEDHFGVDDEGWENVAPRSTTL